MHTLAAMSSFCNMGSASAAKVVPECLSSPSRVLVNKKAMDPPTHPDLLITPLHNHSKLFLPDDMIMPMILTFDKKITLNQGLISTPAADHQSQVAPISSNITAGDTNEDYDKKQVISKSAYQASASPEGQLWPKLTEFDDRPLTPPYQDAIKQVIRESAFLFPKQSELNEYPSNEKSEKMQQVIREPTYVLQLSIDRPPSPSSFKSEKITEHAYHTERGNGPSSPPYKNMIKPLRDSAYQSPNEAELDEALSADNGQPKVQVIREVAYHDKLSDQMRESYRSSPIARLSRVVEESESFSRREFGPNVLNYMSTHSSANHAANLANHSSYNHNNHSNFSYKHPSYHHNNHSNFSYNHSSFQSDNFINSKSAPAGTAVRMGSAFALFRRGSSEGGNLGAGRRVYHRPKSRKSRSLAHTLLWPLLKIRNGYVGCMMGLEGTGDLSGMAQGGTYATKAQYFSDVPLSKIDSRNHG